MRDIRCTVRSWAIRAVKRWQEPTGNPSEKNTCVSCPKVHNQVSIEIDTAENTPAEITLGNRAPYRPQKLKIPKALSLSWALGGAVAATGSDEGVHDASEPVKHDQKTHPFRKRLISSFFDPKVTTCSHGPKA